MSDFDDILAGIAVALDTATGGGASMVIGLPPGALATGAAGYAGVETFTSANAAAPAGTNSRPSSPTAVAAPAAAAIAQRYTIIDGFLLDTCTGKVWKFNEADNSFVAISRKLTQLEFLSTQLRVERMLDQLKTRHADSVLANLPGSMRNEVSKRFQSDYVKAIEDAVAKLKPKA